MLGGCRRILLRLCQLELPLAVKVRVQAQIIQILEPAAAQELVHEHHQEVRPRHRAVNPGTGVQVLFPTAAAFGCWFRINFRVQRDANDEETLQAVNSCDRVDQDGFIAAAVFVLVVAVLTAVGTRAAPVGLHLLVRTRIVINHRRCLLRIDQHEMAAPALESGAQPATEGFSEAAGEFVVRHYDSQAPVETQPRKVRDEVLERVDHLVRILVGRVLALRHVEQEGLEGRPGGLVVALGQQLVSADLEGHRARHDALAAPHHLLQGHLSHARRVRNVILRRLRDVRQEHALGPGTSYERLDDAACAVVAVQVVRLVDHHERVLRRPLLIHLFTRLLEDDAPIPNGRRPRSMLEWLAQDVHVGQDRLLHFVVSDLQLNTQPLVNPLGHEEAQRWISCDEQYSPHTGPCTAGIIDAYLEHIEHAMQTQERLARARRCLQVHVSVAGTFVELILLMRRQLVELENARFILHREIRAVRAHRDPAVLTT